MRESNPSEPATLTPTQAIQKLINTIDSFHLPKGVTPSSVKRALAQLNRNHDTPACNELKLLVSDPAESTGLISIATAACLVLDDGSFSKNTPGILVSLLFQSRASLRKPVSRSSTAIVIY